MGRSLGRWIAVTALATGACATLLTVARADTVCESLSGDTIITGEMRYRTLGGSDECYVNEYYDADGTGAGSDELKLQCASSPGALTGSNMAYFGADVIHQDATTSDGSNVLFTYRLRELTAATCPSGGGCTNQTWTQGIAVPYRVNGASAGSCTGNGCLVNAGKLLRIQHSVGATGLFAAYGAVSTASGCNNSDDGCLYVGSGGCDQIVNF